MDAAHIDFEWGSPADLRKCGVHKLAEHPDTRIWCMSWRIGNSGPVHRWVPGSPDPLPLLDHVRRGGRVISHSATAERVSWNKVVRRRYCPHWPELRIEQQDCTLARCAVLAIPQSMEIAAKVLGAKAAKDMEGNALMRKMATPRAVNPDGTYTWWDSPENIERNGQYCDQDIITEAEIDQLAPQLTDAERAVWMLDQEINDYGVRLDVALIEKAITVRELAKARLNDAIAKVTGGAVAKTTQTKRLMDWITGLGVTCVSIAKSEQASILDQADALLGATIEDDEDDTLDVGAGAPNVVRQAIAIRAEANKTSTAKLTKMLATACDDGCSRGLLHYHGTNTGRWAGRLWQPQNVYRIDPERDGASIHTATQILLACSPGDAHDLLVCLFGTAIGMIAKCLRSMMIARDGNTFKGADLSNIEGRLAAWFTGEEWKLEAFRLYDAKMGPDLYKVAYARSFGIEPKDVGSDQRQIGKVEELALGYQGSVGSFISMAKVYGLKPEKLVPAVMAAAPDEYAAMLGRYAGARDKRGLPQDQWAAIKVIVQGWRAAHPRLVQSWWDLQDAAVAAVSTPGSVQHAMDGKVAYMVASGFLWAQLPSGRCLAYASPRLVRVVEEWIEAPNGRFDKDDFEPEVWSRMVAACETRGATHKTRLRQRVDYDGFDGETKRWTAQSLYGGKQFNHCVQATARDVMAGGMMRAKAAGYGLALTIHDELLCDSPEWHGSAHELEQLMTAGEAWLQGCPLAAKGWEGPRYAK